MQPWRISVGLTADLESGIVIDLFLSYRAVKAWDDMISLVNKMHVQFLLA